MIITIIIILIIIIIIIKIIDFELRDIREKVITDVKDIDSTNVVLEMEMLMIGMNALVVQVVQMQILE